MFSASLLEKYYTVCVGSVLILWLLASAIHQFKFNWWIRISKFDILNLLPDWSFFAPNPGRHDIHLVYRNWNHNDPESWIEFTTYKMSGWRCVWNPNRYCNKALFDLSNALNWERKVYEDDQKSIMLSRSYISILSLVMEQPLLDINITDRQFAIVGTQASKGDRKIELRYISQIHNIGP